MSKNSKFLASFQTRAFRNGGYSLLITAAVVAIAILINALLPMLPPSLIKPSISPYDYYSLTNVTKELVSGLEDKITLNYVVTAGAEDEVLVEFARRYCELSGKLSMRFVDPTVSPAFVDQYSELAGGQLGENSIIVVNEETSDAAVVAYDKVFGRTFASQEEYMYYMMGMDVGTKYFAGENELTSAIEYVTMEVHPTLYYTTGHGEKSFSETLTAVIDTENYDVKGLNLLGEEKPVQDYSIIIVNAPSKDFSEQEVSVLREYMKQGGKVILMTDYAKGDLPLLYGLMKEYGMSFKEGVVVEGNASMYNSQPTILLPNVTASVISQKLTSQNYNILMPLSHAIGTDIQLDTSLYTMTVLMNTSNSAYIKVPSEDNPDMTTEKEEGDEGGIFSLGVMTEHADGGTALWLGSPWFIDDQFLYYNYEYLLAIFSYMTGKEASITIATKTLSDGSLMVSAGAQGVWGLLLIGVIPLGCLGYGLVRWNKRRKR